MFPSRQTRQKEEDGRKKRERERGKREKKN